MFNLFDVIGPKNASVTSVVFTAIFLNQPAILVDSFLENGTFQPLAELFHEAYIVQYIAQHLFHVGAVNPVPDFLANLFRREHTSFPQDF